MVSDADHFVSREFQLSESDPASKGVFFSKGSVWKSQRSKMTPYFTPSRVRAMIPFIQPIADKFTECIAEEGRTGTKFDIAVNSFF